MPGSNVHALQLLARDDVVKVVNLNGIGGPNRLVSEIVDQAEGRPGLAVTLTYLCLQGDTEEVVLGTALARSTRDWLEPKSGSQAIAYLAGLAIGGAAGLPMQTVASAFAKPMVDIRDVTIELAAAGVVKQLDANTLSVSPATLRYALVRDVFFSGASSLDYRILARKAPRLDEVARTLLGAKALGGDVPEDELKKLLEEVQSDEVWARFAWLGPREASIVLREHPELIIAVAKPTLCHAPNEAIPLLLQEAIGDRRALHSNPGQPLRMIKDWIESVHPGTRDGLHRCRTLLHAIQHWLTSGGDPNVAFQSLPFALSPAFELGETDPGSGMTFTLTPGLLTVEELDEIHALWPDALELIRTHRPMSWQAAFEIIESWAYPSEHTIGHTPKDASKRMVDRAAQMLAELVELAGGHQGVLYRARRLARNLHTTFQISLEPEFETIFPDEIELDDEDLRRRRSTRVQKLARAWSERPAKEAASQLVQYESELRVAGHVWPNYLPILSDEIIRNVQSPLEWAAELVGAKCSIEHTFPFLLEAATRKEEGWGVLIRACLNEEPYRLGAALVVLRSAHAPAELVNAAIDCLENAARHVETACLLGEIPECNLARLLRYGDPRIAGAAAVGEWLADPNKSVRAGIECEWCDAIVRHTGDTHFLGEILSGDSELAQRWLTARIQEESSTLFVCDDVVHAAVRDLDFEARRGLIRILPAEYGVKGLLITLVADDCDLYQEVLTQPHLEAHHLAPLEGMGGTHWEGKALLALGHGHSTRAIARAAFGTIEVCWGKSSTKWAAWIRWFDALCSHEDARIREIGEAGRKIVQPIYDSDLAAEQREEIFGR